MLDAATIDRTSRLKSITLVDNYARRKIVTVDVEGGVLVTGANQVGKTSLLRTIPLFFGAAPRNITSYNSGNEAFTRYNFPRDTSYIAYEYVREGRNLLVVTCQDKNNPSAIAYYFIDSPFNETIFRTEVSGRPEASRYIRNKDLVFHVEGLGLTVHGPFRHHQYKEIIQSGVQVSSRGEGDTRALNRTRALFSLCPHGTSMRGADWVVLSVFQRGRSFASIKNCIAAAVHDQGFEAATVGNLRVPDAPEEKLHTLIAKHHQIHAFRDIAYVVQALSEARGQYMISAARVVALDDLAARRIDRLDEAVQEDAKAIDSENQKYAEAEQRYHDQRDSLNQRISSGRADLHATQREIKRLEEERDSYTASDIDGKRAEARRLPELRKRSLEEQGNLRQLKSQHHGFLYGLDEQMNAVDNQRQQGFADLAERRRATQACFSERREQLRDERDRRITAFDEGYRDQEASKLVAVATAQGAVVAAEKELGRPTSDEIDRLEALVAAKRSEKAQEDQSVSEAQDKLATARDDLRAARDAYDMARKADEAARARRGVLKQDYEAARADLAAFDSSLLAFVNDKIPDRSEALRKVLRHDALLSTTLAPKLLEPDGDTLFGIGLDLSGMDPSKCGDQSQLRERLVEASRKLENASEQVENAETSLQSAADALAKADTAVKEAGHRRTIAQNSQAATNEEILKAAEHLETARREAQNTARNKVDEAQASLAQLEEALSSLKEDGRLQKQAIEREFENRRRTIDEDERKSEDGLGEEGQRIEKDWRDARQSLEERRRTALQGETGAALEETERRLRQIEESITSAEKAQTEVDAYDRWFNNEWTRYTSLTQKADSQSAELQSVENELQGVNDSFDELKKEHDRHLKDLHKRRSQSEKDRELLKRTRIQLQDTLPDVSAKPLASDDHLDATGVVEQINQHMDACRKNRVAGLRARRTVSSCREKCPILGRRLDTLLQESGFPPLLGDGTQDDWIDILGSLKIVFNDLLDQEEVTIQQSFDLMCWSLRDIREKLEEAAKEIKNLGRRIAARLSEMGAAFDTIEATDARITCDLESLRFWRALCRAVDMSRSVTHDARAEDRGALYKAIEDASIALPEQQDMPGLADLISVSLAMTSAGEKPKHVDNDRGLETISSNGLSYIFQIILYAAILDVSGRSKDVRVVWPIDELSSLSDENIVKLKALLVQRGIDLATAAPGATGAVMSLYANKYEIVAGRQVRKVISTAAVADEIAAEIAEQEAL